MNIERIVMLRTILVIATLAVFVSACGRSPAVKYYTLTETPIAATGEATDMAVTIGPASFPRSLARNQIVTRKSVEQLNVDEFNVWSAPLQYDFLRVLGDNVATELNSDRIVIYPTSASFDVDYRVILDVMQFDGALGENVILRVRWAIKPPGGEVSAVGSFSKTQVIAQGDKSYDALVAAHSAAIAELSQAITAELSALGKPVSN
jgi:uncharacterized lipoprotein YmbA